MAEDKKAKVYFKETKQRGSLYVTVVSASKGSMLKNPCDIIEMLMSKGYERD
ncbi:hypothetical protein IWW45_001809 [Coemansia sp. RSA 485]|nr:hypothetical protein IWW45_001809 [Coemansia sp. RSA 485]